MANPKVLILAGDAAESLEVMYPYQRLLEEGYTVHTAGPARKKLQFVVHDFVDGTTPTPRSPATLGRPISPSPTSIRPPTPPW